MNNDDLQNLMNMLKGMDKKDLETGLQKASAVLNSNDKDTIINALKKLQK